jgi:sulfite exporter TauE/SafE
LFTERWASQRPVATTCGFAALVAFGAATSPALLALGDGLQRLTKMGPGAKQFLAVVVSLAGLWALSQRIPDLERERMDC